MNPSAIAPLDLPAPVQPASPAAAPGRHRRRSLSERLRKPASWLALASFVPVWLALPQSRSAGLAITADALGLLAVIAAMLGRVWCALYIAGRKNAELCQDGPYSLVRNPLYVFSFVGTLGVALAAHRWALVPLAALLFLAYYHLVVKAEEARLAALFPEAYPAYCRAVPRGLPRLAGFHSRKRLTLDPRDVTRALLEVIWFPAAFVAVAALSRLA